MEKFWKLFRRLNVPLIAILAVLALVAMIAWKLWLGHATPWKVVEPPTLDEAERGDPAEGESFFSWSRELRAPRGITRNPFTSPILDDFLAQQELERLAAERAAAEREAAERAAALEAAAAKAAAEQAAAQRAAEAAAATELEAAQATTTKRPEDPAETRDVVLVYRGMMTRPDQVTLALVENRTEETASFYAAGDRIAGVSIGAIERNTLEVRIREGSNQLLRVNEPITLKEIL